MTTHDDASEAFLHRYLKTLPTSVVGNVCKRSESGQIFGRRRLGPCVVGMIDISGFTKLTEKYIHNKDKIQQIINTVIAPLMDIIKESHFELIDIAGDALMFYQQCLKESSTLGLTKCLMAYVVKTRAFVETSSIFKSQGMEMKYAAVHGDLHVDIFEGARHGWLIDGPAFKGLAKAMKNAGRGEFVVDESMHVSFKQMKIILNKRGNFFLVPASSRAIPGPGDIPQDADVMEPENKEKAKAILDKFVPDLVDACENSLPSISDAAIVPAAICFLSVKNTDATPVSQSKLQEFYMSSTQTLVERAGFKRQFIRDDKGTVFIGIFRSSKEVVNPAHNAMLWALDVEKIGANCSLKLAMGISMGTLYEGPLGTPDIRIDFTLMGFEVNLSARYMAWAVKCQNKSKRPDALNDMDTDQITLVTEGVAKEASNCGVNVISIGAQKIKGSEEMFEAFALTTGDIEEKSDQAHPDSFLDDLPAMYGHENANAEVETALKTDGVCLIEGVTGVGTTLLSCHMIKKFCSILKSPDATEQPLTAIVTANSARKNEDYLPVKVLLKALNAQSKLLEDGPDIFNHLKDMIAMPLYNDRIGLLMPFMPWIKTPLPASDESFTLSDKETKESTVELLIRLLIHIGTQRTFAIVFDDFQFYDEKSSQVITKSIAALKGKRNKRNMAIIIATSSPAEPNADAIKETVHCVMLTPLDSIQDTFKIVLDDMKVDLSRTAEIYEKNQTFARMIHEAAEGLPGMIRSCAQSMIEDGAVKASKKTFRLMRAIEDVPIFKSFQSKNVAKYLKMDKTEQVVLKYAALMGVDFDNTVLQATLLSNGVEEESFQKIQDKLVQEEFFVRGRENILSFNGGAIANAIKSTMLEQQQMQFCTRLSNEMGAVRASKDVQKSLKKCAMARALNSGMGQLGKNRLGHTLIEYARLCEEHGYTDLASDLYIELVDDLDAFVDVTFDKEKHIISQVTTAKNRIAPKNTKKTKKDEIAELEKRSVLSVCEVHEIYTKLANMNATIDMNISLKYIKKACDLVNFPFCDESCGSGMASTSGYRLSMGILNLFRYPTIPIKKAETTGLIRNHIKICNAATYIYGSHLGCKNAFIWWMNEGRNIQNRYPSPGVNSQSNGHYASSVVTYSKKGDDAIKAFADYSKSLDEANKVIKDSDGPVPFARRGLDSSSISRVSFRMMRPLDSDPSDSNEYYNTWASSFIDGKSAVDDFYSLCGPMIVYCAYGKSSGPSRIKDDSANTIKSTAEKMVSIIKIIERTCIANIMWFCGHMICGKYSGSIQQYRTEIVDRYEDYLRNASLSAWAVGVFPGTKILTLAIHHARVCSGPIFTDNAHTIMTIIVSLEEQIKETTIATKQILVVAFMAFDVVTILLASLKSDLRQQFRKKLKSLEQWAFQTLEKKGKQIFPEFQAVCLQTMRATTKARKQEKEGIDALKIAAVNAKAQDFMLVYTSTIIIIAVLSKDHVVLQGLEDSMAETGLAKHAAARVCTANEIMKL